MTEMTTTTTVPWLTLAGANDAVTACEFVQGADKDCLVVGLENGLVLCWDLLTKKVLWQQKDRIGNKVQGLKTFTNDACETLIAVLTRNDRFLVYNLTNLVGRQSRAGGGHKERTDPEGKEKGSVGDDDEDEDDFKIMFPAKEYETALKSLSFCPLVSVSVEWPEGPCCDAVIAAESGNPKVVVDDDAADAADAADGSRSTAVGFSRRSTYFGLATGESQFSFVDAFSWKVNPVPNPDYGMVMCAELFELTDAAPKGTDGASAETGQVAVYGLVGYENGHVVMYSLLRWDGDARCPRVAVELVADISICEAPVLSLAFCVTKQTLAVGAADNKLRLYKVDQPKTCEVDAKDAADSREGCIGFAPVAEIETPDVLVSQISVREGPERLFAAAFGDNMTRIYSHKGRLLAELEGHADSVLCLAHSQPLKHVSLSFVETKKHIPGILLASGSRDCTTCLWSLYNKLW